MLIIKCFDGIPACLASPLRRYRPGGRQHHMAVGKGETMTGRKRTILRALAAAATAVVLAAAVPPTADADGNRKHRGKPAKVFHQRHHHGTTWVAPAPPPLPRPVALPRPRVITVPRVIQVSNRPAYVPYYAGTVYYQPYGVDLDVYYFPVQMGTRVVYQPYYYYDNELFFTSVSGQPRFYFQLRF